MTFRVGPALRFAIKEHGEQKYGNAPYRYHLHDVLFRTEDLGPSFAGFDGLRGAVLNSAILHDVIEDTSCTLEGLRTNFGERVADAVDKLSKNLCPPDEVYLDRVMSDPIAHLVKIADTLCNLTESVRSQDLRRIQKYTTQLMHLHSKPVGRIF